MYAGDLLLFPDVIQQGSFVKVSLMHSLNDTWENSGIDVEFQPRTFLKTKKILT